MGGVMEEEVVRGCLRRFLEDFPAPLGPEDPLPLNPLSRKVTLDELRGESLDLGLRLLNTRDAPSTLNAAMCHAALAELLKADLSPFHLPQETEQQQGEEQEVVLLQSEPVQRLFLNKLREVGVAWHQNLPSPLPIGSSRFLMCSAHAIRNTRRKMEDRHVTLPDFNTLTGLKDGVERGYYAVFDGHGGVDAAIYAATHLHVTLSQQEELQSDPATAFKTAFTRTDDMLRGKAKRERLRSGTTGVAVLLQGEWLHVAWLGDSQSMLVRRGQDITLMDPHKPDREDEKQRVEGLGGCIVFMGCWRVNGTYAVSRAIGDFDQKPYVSGDADCSSTRLHGDEDYILLACDGFFDVVRPAEVPALVLGALREQGEPQGAVEGAGCEEISEGVLGERVAQELVAHAKAAGSSDNITVMVVFLCPPAQLLLQDQSNIAVATEGPAQE
ncbi:protein phosphatase 1F isoform X1 [Oncorhynchus keta]|uniref:protein phosphatase 1F isoform X1 n=1 Tax=Oncorhynchus keta TaxID=8018 RepID=UPI00227AC43D|nr:protein phosphatase 1F isoform X1 [Oncorhynchus keta]XP_052316904.1 protein phosphatase 1F isoform X1 [Oncorhynchus keta]XP_052316905.1 protein phosphatase 1F isoform X1 [Oncorhynchus keta]XP_052316907.1 protein phosphatase 1F isoform X1 [Oncorhynchus keta]XP_052316908.1 protein phosphatase 1F isoform X1 [Oncorhynchus keta]XP_052316909.1 protein phosphatase 1F isoform X1 [Oncorhynchus keta]XP_052316910.1 protein phosphatase 1F isoform X1 [Oncorhynchus keta]XP_052316911.1 protein phosphata